MTDFRSMQKFREQGEDNHRRECHEGRPGRLSQPPERVTEDSHREARGVLRFLGPDGGRPWPGQKCVRIALGQQLERPFPDFGADQCELGMDLPRLDVGIRRRRDGTKPAFESKRRFKGDGGQTTIGYRRPASLT